MTTNTDADGGLNHLPDDITAWERKAHANVQKWGLQDLDAVTLAMGEEMGEWTEQVLKLHKYGDSGPDAERGRDLLRRMKDLGDDIRDHLETVSEDADGTPIPSEDRPNYLTPAAAEPIQSLSVNHAGEELDDLGALHYQARWALDGVGEGSTDE